LAAVDLKPDGSARLSAPENTGGVAQFGIVLTSR
jgi:hypothetical protein